MTSSSFAPIPASVRALSPEDAERLGNVSPVGWRSPKPLPIYHLLVIGAGPAGLVAARAAAALGAHVALIERHQIGGGPHKVDAGPAGQFAIGLQLVAHHLGNRQLGDGLGQRLLQALGQRCALGGAFVEQRFGLAVDRALQSRHGQDHAVALYRGGHGGCRWCELSLQEITDRDRLAVHAA